MIKTLKYSLLLLCLPVAAWAADFKAGEHYQVLEAEASEADKVTEFFSFYCPHCFKLEPIVGALEESLPEGVPLVKSHVNFLRIDKDAQNRLTRAYLVAKEEGKDAEVAQAIFDSIHRQREPLQTQESVEALLAEQGIDAQRFAMLAASEPVVNGEKEAVDDQTTYSKLGALTGVPTLIVNDKYKVHVHKVASQQELNELVNYLLEK
ncbi:MULTISPECIES: thiol:disulfide interchange protein DsbA/DsbL [Pseudoalteromonas]|uniref:Thiol:disulfide interchange protein n=1 Tax=Pseudoalteromonas ruthenica TaxID=151081 RepID=A0A0F4PUM9_9GAMM|nr:MULTISPECIES: thiol:disulfide interchange protein DsbA/DsbL [Pseudoalteromonas]KJY97966.1 disulfide bond formation protein [Pseudoalteromonas ruthenica]KJZ01991.1 disulfide bond formation protein [Pseudoalteromonas ruthenica]MCF2862543.1 thiol:disulfide interchange protein DsbA/DsbL [Pseudoalteromonas sp. CNAT2-18]MCG7544759.1 thiol:disulfide interchange protein DsbA/DsbL [Pseudoalteromonas sp. MM17-2]MCG7559005.1 thiol:disulfide interchange protein DsbA/DsbL [Pseudoalteromonas sp. CNAT2-18